MSKLYLFDYKTIKESEYTPQYAKRLADDGWIFSHRNIFDKEVILKKLKQPKNGVSYEHK